eukprot:scaffold32420_cov68-Phaeocystis_antarctica.AAC.6
MAARASFCERVAFCDRPAQRTFPARLFCLRPLRRHRQRTIRRIALVAGAHGATSSPVPVSSGQHVPTSTSPGLLRVPNSGSAGARREDSHEQVVRQFHKEHWRYGRLHRLVFLIPAGSGRVRQCGRTVQLPRLRHLGHEAIAQLPREPERDNVIASRV